MSNPTPLVRKLYPSSTTISRLYESCRFKCDGFCSMRWRKVCTDDCEPRHCWTEVRSRILQKNPNPLLEEYTEEEILDFLKNYRGTTNPTGDKKPSEIFVEEILSSSIYLYTIFLLGIDMIPLYINTTDARSREIIKWRLYYGR